MRLHHRVFLCLESISPVGSNSCSIPAFDGSYAVVQAGDYTRSYSLYPTDLGGCDELKDTLPARANVKELTPVTKRVGTQRSMIST